jgi:hypothetical protein
MTSKAITVVILTYFAVVSITFLSAYFFPSDGTIPILLSMFLLIPIYIWHRNYTANKKQTQEVNGRNKIAILLWIFALFFLALSVRIPFVLLFGAPYEKTSLIYLVILTIVVIEKTDISAIGFKTQNIGKAFLHGLAFYVLLGGITLIVLYSLIYAFTNQTPVLSYNIAPFVLAMPFQTLCVGVSEEGLFRGYMQTHLLKSYTLKKAILIQAIFFGVWHFVWNLSPFNPWGMAQYVTVTFLVGIVFGYFYSKARNLAPLIFAHGLWNSVQGGILTNLAALDALQRVPLLNQILVWLLPYAISATLTVLFIKLFVKEI